MKKIIFLLAVFSLCFSLSAAKKTIWLSDYETALETAKKNNKPIYMLLTNPVSCGPCIRFEKKVIGKTRFERFLKKKFVPMMINYGPAYVKNKSKQISINTILKNSKLPKGFKTSGGWPKVIILSPEGKRIYDSTERTYGDANKYKKHLTKFLRDLKKKKK